MSEWWTYRLEDFLMFAPRTWWRLVEQHNAAWWPAPLVACLAGAAAWWTALRPRPWAPRALAGLLAIAWAGVAMLFHAQRHAEINLLGPWLAAGSGLQAVLLAAVAAGIARDDRPAGPVLHRAGLAVAAAAVFLYPLAGLPFGRPLAQAEVFGWMPDPTALATLGWLLANALHAGRWTRALLCVIPAVALAIGWLTRLAMAQ